MKNKSYLYLYLPRSYQMMSFFFIFFERRKTCGMQRHIWTKSIIIKITPLLSSLILWHKRSYYIDVGTYSICMYPYMYHLTSLAYVRLKCIRTAVYLPTYKWSGNLFCFRRLTVVVFSYNLIATTTMRTIPQPTQKWRLLLFGASESISKENFNVIASRSYDQYTYVYMVAVDLRSSRFQRILMILFERKYSLFSYGMKTDGGSWGMVHG